MVSKSCGLVLCFLSAAFLGAQARHVPVTLDMEFSLKFVGGTFEAYEAIPQSEKKIANKIPSELLPWVTTSKQIFHLMDVARRFQAGAMSLHELGEELMGLMESLLSAESLESFWRLVRLAKNGEASPKEVGDFLSAAVSDVLKTHGEQISQAVVAGQAVNLVLQWRSLNQTLATIAEAEHGLFQFDNELRPEVDKAVAEARQAVELVAQTENPSKLDKRVARAIRKISTAESKIQSCTVNLQGKKATLAELVDQTLAAAVRAGAFSVTGIIAAVTGVQLQTNPLFMALNAFLATANFVIAGHNLVARERAKHQLKQVLVNLGQMAGLRKDMQDIAEQLDALDVDEDDL